MVQSDSAKPAPQERLHSLDALRGLAALLVVFFHHTDQNRTIGLVDLGIMFPHPFGRLGQILSTCGGIMVQFFYVLSGFVFYRTYRRRIEERNVDFQTFCVARFARLFPLAWLGTAIVILIRITQKIVFGDSVPDMQRIILDVFLAGGKIFTADKTSILGPTWSLSAEIAAYLVFFLIAYNSKRKNGLLLYVIPVFVGLYIFNLKLEYGIINADFIRVFFGFFAGCLTCELWDWGKKVKKRNSRITTAGVIVFFSTFLVYFFLPKSAGNSSVVFSLALFPALIIIFLNVKAIKNFFSLLPFRWLGDLSYSIYLIHLIIISHITNMLINHFGMPENIVNNWSFLLGEIAVVLVLSHFSYYHFEKPMMNRINGKYKAWKAAGRP